MEPPSASLMRLNSSHSSWATVAAARSAAILRGTITAPSSSAITMSPGSASTRLTATGTL